MWLWKELFTHLHEQVQRASFTANTGTKANRRRFKANKSISHLQNASGTYACLLPRLTPSFKIHSEVAKDLMTHNEEIQSTIFTAAFCATKMLPK